MRTALLAVIAAVCTLTYLRPPAQAPAPVVFVQRQPSPAMEGLRPGETLCVGTAELRARQLSGIAPASRARPVDEGDAVLARWSDGNWWRARVVRPCAGVDCPVAVAWLDGSGIDEVAASDVAPMPAEPASLGEGDRALCEWRGQPRWWRAEVIARRDDALEVAYIDGTVATVPRDGCVPAR